MEWIWPILIGVGLSAACGFRVFLPLLAMSLAARSGVLSLSPGFEWIGSDAGTAAFAVAAFLEVSAYLIPWVDNLLDSIATPAAVLAGILATASLLGDFSPFSRWALAIIAGGGAAGLVQASTVAGRGLSSASTGGLANPLFSLFETLSAAGLSLLAILIPVAALVLAAALSVFILTRLRRKRQTRKT
jgi:hypothetical protein